jgi:hypothetical protein
LPSTSCASDAPCAWLASFAPVVARLAWPPRGAVQEEGGWNLRRKMLERG